MSKSEQPEARNCGWYDETGDSEMAGERYVVMKVECPRCKTKQKVHVNARPGISAMGEQTVPCLLCNIHFKVNVPDRIIRGPFPP
jgi:hypothetical protein